MILRWPHFDGTSLYEHSDPAKLSRDGIPLSITTAAAKINNYLVGNALYWIERFGIDALRVDAWRR